MQHRQPARHGDGWSPRQAFIADTLATQGVQRDQLTSRAAQRRSPVSNAIPPRKADVTTFEY